MPTVEEHGGRLGADDGADRGDPATGNASREAERALGPQGTATLPSVMTPASGQYRPPAREHLEEAMRNNGWIHMTSRTDPRIRYWLHIVSGQAVREQDLLRGAWPGP